MSATVGHHESGYTLVELAVVVLLLAIVSGFFVSKFNITDSWGSQSAVKELANKIEFLLQDSSAKKINYEIEFYSNGSGYRIWQIAKKLPNQTVNVDTLKNLRSQKAQERQEQKSAEQALKNLDQEYLNENKIDQLPLQVQFYSEIFDDPHNLSRKIPPLEYPSMVNGVNFPPSVRVKSIKKESGSHSLGDDNSVILSHNLTAQDAQIELESNGETVNLLVRPFERKTLIRYQNDKD